MIKDNPTQILLDALLLSHKNNDKYQGWCPGYFANVVQLSSDISIAFAMDGIGLKIKLAQLAEDYSGVGYDCIAACVNDLLCVGAEPVAFLDYLHMSNFSEQVLHDIGTSFKNAAMDLKLNILGGETSIYGSDKSHHVDVCGTAIGKLFFRTPIMGHDIRQGNIIIGLHSSGIHANGTTEAIKSFTKEDLLNTHPVLKVPLISQLLTPSRCYAQTITDLFRGGVKPTGMVNISGGGITNMLRLRSQGVAYEFNHFPEIPDLFKVIRVKSGLTIDKMVNIFNMGIGFYVIIQQDEYNTAIKILDKHTSIPYSVMGKVVPSDQKRVSWSMSHEHM